MVTRILFAMGLVLWAASPTRADDRAAELEKLLAEYEAAEAVFFEQDFPANPTDADKIERYKAYPRWAFLPKFLAIVEADPSDAAAFAASRWIVEQTSRLGSQWMPLFDAEKTAWRVIREQSTIADEDVLPLCLKALNGRSPACEAFLRDLATRTDLPGDGRAFATTALAEYLAQRFNEIEAGDSVAWWLKPKDEYFEYLSTQLDEEWIEYMTGAEGELIRREGIELFRRVLEDYADVPMPIDAPYFRGITTLGQKAKKSLHALEHLVIGAVAPDAVGHDLDGNSLRLSDYRGKVVLLSFWFPTCGPCIAAIPEEQELVERFGDQPFALLGVCRESDSAVAKQVATEHGMSWPSWLDGKPGEITDAYNVRSWPTFYLLDAKGRIVSKNVSWGDGRLAEAVEAVLRAPVSETAAE